MRDQNEKLAESHIKLTRVKQNEHLEKLTNSFEDWPMAFRHLVNILNQNTLVFPGDQIYNH